MHTRFLRVFCAAVMTAACGCETNETTNTTQLPDVGPIESRSDPEPESGSFYTVAEYDPGEDPSADLVATVSQASEGGKRIILEIGGHW